MKAALNVIAALAVLCTANIAAAEITEVITETATGHMLTKSYDDNNDGTVERVRTYTYDAAGNELSVVFERFGQNAFANETTHDYDYEGHLVRTSVDNDRDGSIDLIVTFHYENGHLVAERMDRGVDGTVDRAVSYSYDAAGNLVSEAFDRDGDGTIDKVKTHATVVAQAR